MSRNLVASMIAVEPLKSPTMTSINLTQFDFNFHVDLDQHLHVWSHLNDLDTHALISAQLPQFDSGLNDKRKN